jgi:hypothetical protein
MRALHPKRTNIMVQGKGSTFKYVKRSTKLVYQKYFFNLFFNCFFFWSSREKKESILKYNKYQLVLLNHCKELLN